MSTPIKITSETPAQFPCWLWNNAMQRWFRASGGLCDRIDHASAGFTHWHPDQPEAPTVVPEGEAQNAALLPHPDADRLREAVEGAARRLASRVNQLFSGTLTVESIDKIVREAKEVITPLLRPAVQGEGQKREPST